MTRNLMALVGEDQVGVVALATKVLLDKGANLGQVTQMVLDGQFGSFFIYTAPPEVTAECVRASMREAIRASGLSLDVVVRAIGEAPAAPGRVQPFVLCVWGKDCCGIIHAFSRLLGASGINIENLRAMRIEETGEYLARFEIALPEEIDRKALAATLAEKGATMGLTVTMQHRDIFEAVNRVKTF